MERKTLFRGKRLDNGEWMDGDLVLSAGYPDKAWIVESKTFIDKQLHGIGVREVDRATIGQYTGLTDKNGVKIFEGDIVYAETLNNKGHYQVKFKFGQFFIGINMPVAYVRDSCEVVGNIHDNPELLEAP